MKKRFIAALATVVVAASFAVVLGGGASASPKQQKLTDVTLQLKWVPQAQFAGYYVALDQGYFAEEGFDDVEIVPSGGDIVPQDALIAGDVDFDTAKEVASLIPPVPGGVGPMTIACLLENTLTLACRKHGVPVPT